MDHTPTVTAMDEDNASTEQFERYEDAQGRLHELWQAGRAKQSRSREPTLRRVKRSDAITVKSEYHGPDTDELREQYVAGEIDEQEFEDGVERAIKHYGGNGRRGESEETDVVAQSFKRGVITGLTVSVWLSLGFVAAANTPIPAATVTVAAPGTALTLFALWLHGFF